MAASETALDSHEDECAERYKALKDQNDDHKTAVTKLATTVADGFAALHTRISNANTARNTLVYSVGAALIVLLFVVVGWLLVHGTPYIQATSPIPNGAPFSQYP